MDKYLGHTVKQYTTYLCYTGRRGRRGGPGPQAGQRHRGRTGELHSLADFQNIFCGLLFAVLRKAMLA